MFFKALERIRSLSGNHAGKTFTPERFTHLLRMQFRDSQLRFVCQRDSKVTKKNFWIKGEYRPFEDEHDEPCVYIMLVFSPRCRKVSFHNYDWDSMSFHLADIITHEYLHQYYCRLRGYRHGRGYRQATTLRYQETMQDYLGCEDEILAHGFNVASEMVVYNRPMEKTRTYQLYKKHFKQDLKVLLQLKKQAVKYIKRLELGYEQTESRTRTRYR